MGLSKFEYEEILRLMGREPSYTELGMFAVMWSEHCSYKCSRPVLSYFSEYKKAMEGDGLENAGVVDIGDGLGVVMKVESHNHPSAVEPYQGAATGVGGIIRDIFTMGARPIAALNSLRFGPITKGKAPDDVVARNRFLVDGVVAGIAGYGNCVGVPTIAGEVGFHPRYSGNPLVNAMCVGIVPLDSVTTSGAFGVGNPVIYLGSATGKDGIHGATFASDVLGEDSDAKRPNVQIGDPFAEKLLIEATLEALKTGAVAAIQDMGAAGLTCSTIEMSAKGGVGMEVNLDLVPMREDDMTAYELMLSESQERMLAVAHRGREHDVINVFRKWGVHAEVIGHVTDSGRVVIIRRGEIAADVQAKDLADGCPIYDLKGEEPAYYQEAKNWNPPATSGRDFSSDLLTLLAAPSIASKRWIYQQYDAQVQTQTSITPGLGDSAVLAPRGTKKGLSVKIDGNGRWVYFDPYVGGQLAVAEACRNVACTGGLPVAATDGLNYGNPQLGHVFWQFERSVKGIADACEAMGTPVVSGNVSFYNESELGEVLPTPLIGILGVLEDASNAITQKAKGGQLGLIYYSNEAVQDGLGASAYGLEVLNVDNGVPVPPNMKLERQLCESLAKLANEAKITAAHDVSEGGLAVALAEMLFGTKLAAKVRIGSEIQGKLSDAGLLFGEHPGWVIVEYSATEAQKVRDSLPNGLHFAQIGDTVEGSGRLTFETETSKLLDVSLTDCEQAYENAIPKAMAGQV